MSSEDIEEFLEPPPLSLVEAAASSSSSPNPNTRLTNRGYPIRPSDHQTLNSLGQNRQKSRSSRSLTTSPSLNRHRWIRDLHIYARRGKSVPAELFRFCATTIQSGGGDLASFPLSTEGICLKSIELDEQTANAIKV